MVSQVPLLLIWTRKFAHHFSVQGLVKSRAQGSQEKLIAPQVSRSSTSKSQQSVLCVEGSYTVLHLPKKGPRKRGHLHLTGGFWRLPLGNNPTHPSGLKAWDTPLAPTERQNTCILDYCKNIGIHDGFRNGLVFILSNFWALCHHQGSCHPRVNFLDFQSNNPFHAKRTSKHLQRLRPWMVHYKWFFQLGRATPISMSYINNFTHHPSPNQGDNFRLSKQHSLSHQTNVNVPPICDAANNPFY